MTCGSTVKSDEGLLQYNTIHRQEWLVGPTIRFFFSKLAKFNLNCHLGNALSSTNIITLQLLARLVCGRVLAS